MVYFVTEQRLKDTTSVTANVDNYDIIPIIKSAADMWVRSILGTTFYNDLLTKYNNETLSANETTLVGYIQPAVAWRAAADLAFELSYQLKNKGIQTQSGDYSASGQFSEVSFNAHHKAQKAEFYESRLKTYLNNNKSLFPVFESDANDDSIVKDCNEDNGVNTNIIFI